MKTSLVLLALSLALSASAAPRTSHNEVRQFGGFGNNNFGGNRNNDGGNRDNNTGGGRNSNGGGRNNTGGNNNQNGGAAGGNNGAANNGTTTGGNSGAANNGTTTGGNNASGGAAAGNGNSTSTGNNSQDPQQSLTLDPKVIATGFANDGQDVPAAGQIASLTSTNNFINFCLTVPNLPITNGQQIKTGSCNPAPMGVLPSTDNMPSSKFVSPKNGDTIKSNTAFTITMAIQGMETGFFVNANENYFSAPQFLNKNGQIQGHSHVVVETLDAIDQTTPLDPQKFAFFKGLNAAAQNGQLTADVDKGLPAGVYKLSSINAAANHQPVLVPIAQHGSLDDAVYFTVTDNGQPDASSGVLNGNNNGTAAGNTGAGTGNVGAGTGNAGAGNTTTSTGNVGAGNATTSTGNAGAGVKGGKGNTNNNQNTGGNQNNNNGGRPFGGFGGFGGRNRRFARSRL